MKALVLVLLCAAVWTSHAIGYRVAEIHAHTGQPRLVTLNRKGVVPVRHELSTHRWVAEYKL